MTIIAQEDQRPEELIIDILNLSQVQLTDLVRKVRDDTMNDKAPSYMDIDRIIQGFTLPLSMGLADLVKYSKSYAIKHDRANQVSESNAVIGCPACGDQSGAKGMDGSRREVLRPGADKEH